MKNYIFLKITCHFFGIGPILAITMVYVATFFNFRPLLGLGVIIFFLSFYLKNMAKKITKGLLGELAKDDRVNFTVLAKATKLFSSIFLKNIYYYDDLEKDLKQNLRKKNKWQGLVSTEYLYDCV